MPIAANCHGLTSAKIPWLAADAARTPSKKAPLTLTTIVPHGNVSPTRRATKPDSQNLAVPPSTLPRATHITPLIVSTACLDFFSGYSLLKSCAGTFTLFISPFDRINTELLQWQGAWPFAFFLKRRAPGK